MSSEASKRSLSGNEEILIFSDVSADPQLKTGFGAYLAITETELDVIDPSENSNDSVLLRGKLKVKPFTATSSTRLEIETVLWALQDLIHQHPTHALVNNITLYTDSQSIINLPRRRMALEQSGFSSARGRALNQAALYRAFYQLHDQLGFNLIKLKGHSKGTAKTRHDRVFSYVDRAARKALRSLKPS